MRTILTLTGVDAKTDVAWMEQALKRVGLPDSRFSALEFGILRSPKIDQSPRYPGRDTVRKITSSLRPGDLAFHLCGRYARMVHSLEWAELCDIIDFNQVGRVQVNSTESDEKAMITLMRFSAHIGKPVIMQWRGDTFPAVPGLSLLQDRSGGTGVTETRWSLPDQTCRKSTTQIGYAGGLGPHNIKQALPQIALASKGMPFWVDCESSLRTDDWFDQEKADAMIDGVVDTMPSFLKNGER